MPTLIPTKKRKREIARALACGYATPGLLDDVPPEELIEIKRDLPWVTRGMAVAAHYDPETHTSTWTASAQVRDSYDTVFIIGTGPSDGIRQDQGTFATGMASALFNHNPDHVVGGVPTARTVKEVDRNTTGVGPDRVPVMRQTIQHTGDVGEMATLVENLVRRGVLPGVSIGAHPMAVRLPNDEETNLYGLGPAGLIYESMAQMELSLTPIPANPMGVGLSKRSLDEIDAHISTHLDDLVETGQLTRSLVSDFRKGWLPGVKAERAASRVRGFVHRALDFREDQMGHELAQRFGELGFVERDEEVDVDVGEDEPIEPEVTPTGAFEVTPDARDEAVEALRSSGADVEDDAPADSLMRALARLTSTTEERVRTANEAAVEAQRAAREARAEADRLTLQAQSTPTVREIPAEFARTMRESGALDMLRKATEAVEETAEALYGVIERVDAQDDEDG